MITLRALKVTHCADNCFIGCLASRARSLHQIVRIRLCRTPNTEGAATMTAATGLRISAVVLVRFCSLAVRSQLCSTPNRCTSLISLGLKIVGAPVGIRLGVLGVVFDHQHRDTPDVDLLSHGGKRSLVCISN